nr:Tau-tubulin kinase 2 [Haemonchus contortus]
MGEKRKKPKKKKPAVEREKMKEGDTVQSEQFTWRVVKLLGSGGFGDVYKVQKVNNPDKTESAMKTEMVIGNRQMLRLKIEVVVLMKCHEQTDPDRKGHFVAFVDRGKTEKFKFLVMGLVGPSLEDIRKKDLVRNYSKGTAMQCCIQTMTALRDLHGIGYLHRDIKPQNYAIGLGPKESTIYMLDFGIARKFTEGETKKVKLPRIKVHFLGTLRFASRACHKQIEQGRKDDLECWLYMCFDLFDDDKGLPWKRCERNEILAMKQKFFKLEIPSCYGIVPEDFKRIVQYIDGLNYADEPDYVSVIREKNRNREATRHLLTINKRRLVQEKKRKNRKGGADSKVLDKEGADVHIFRCKIFNDHFLRVFVDN